MLRTNAKENLIMTIETATAKENGNVIDYLLQNNR